MQPHDFTPNASKAGPLSFCAQAAAIEHPAAIVRKRGRIGGVLPQQLHARSVLKRAQQGLEQSAVVELPFPWQVQAAWEPRAKARLHCVQPRGVQLDGGLEARQIAQRPGRAGQERFEPPGFRDILPVPDDDRAFTLKEHGFGQGLEDFGPTLQSVHAHAHDGPLGHG